MPDGVGPAPWIVSGDKHCDQLRNGCQRHYDARLAAEREYLDANLRAIREAVSVAAEVTRVHFENVNEWRDQSKDRERTYAQRDTTDDLAERLGKLENAQSRGEGRSAGMLATVAMIISVLSFLIGVAKLFL